MIQFDVLRRRDGAEGYFLNCQSDLLDDFDTRFVVPLLRPAYAPKPAVRLNPTFSILGEPHLMVTQFAGAVRLVHLGEPVMSLREADTLIVGALDILLSGV